jgi:hypothetical protein
MARIANLSPRVNSVVYTSVKASVDPLLGVTGSVGALVRDVVAGRMPEPTPCEDLGIRDDQASVRLPETTWVSEITGESDPRYATTRARTALVRELIYALADGRVGVRVSCEVKKEE